MEERDSLLLAHYQAQYGKLVKRMYGRTKVVEAAEDIVQEAFSRAFKYWANPDNIEAWFNTLLNNAMRDFMRADKMQGCSYDTGDEDWECQPMSDWAEDMWVQVQADIANQPEANRQILYLYYECMYKPREIKEIVEETNGVIRITIHRFRLFLEAKYKKVITDG